MWRPREDRYGEDGAAETSGGSELGTSHTLLGPLALSLVVVITLLGGDLIPVASSQRRGDPKPHGVV